MRREEGFMLIELLLAAALMTVILLATLGVFDSALQTHKRNATQNDAQDSARTQIDRLARELRNVADPGQPTALERATDNDLVFTMVNPTGSIATASNPNSLLRVRYCLDTSVPTNEKLWRATQPWQSGGAAPSSFCPDTSWGTPAIVADHLVNTAAQPVFQYDSSNPANVTQLRTNLFVDFHPGTAPGPSTLKTSVAIRSTAQAPSASATATAMGSRQVLLNGGASTDPAGQPLTYSWYDVTSGTTIGSSAILNYFAPATGSRTFRLTVTNPAGLTATATQTVNVT